MSGSNRLEPALIGRRCIDTSEEGESKRRSTQKQGAKATNKRQIKKKSRNALSV